MYMGFVTEKLKKYAQTLQLPALYVAVTKEDVESARYKFNLAGYCMGSCISFNVLSKAGKLNWWLNVLEAILAWDEKPESLAMEVKVPGSTNDQAVKLSYLFEMVGSFYVLILQWTFRVSTKVFPKVRCWRQEMNIWKLLLKIKF